MNMIHLHAVNKILKIKQFFRHNNCGQSFIMTRLLKKKPNFKNVALLKGKRKNGGVSNEGNDSSIVKLA